MATRVIIVGAGVIGLSAALECVGRGLRVTVVDRHPARRTGCSFGNAGMVVPSHFTPLAAPGMVALGLKWMWNPESPFYIKPRLDWHLLAWALRFWAAANSAHVRRASPLLRDLHLASRTAYEQWTEGGLDTGLVKNGLLMLCRTGHMLDEEAKTAADAVRLGVPAEVLTPEQAAALDPDVEMDIQGAVYFPNDCHLSPERLMASLEQRLEALGVQFLWETPVIGWRRDQRRLATVKTPIGEFEADEFVLSAGMWSAEAARPLGLRLPMEAGKGYSLTLEQPRQLPQICAILAEARVAVTPMDGRLRFGGTMELSGLDERINPRRVAGIVKAVPQYYPGFRTVDFDGITPWCGLRPCSPDGLPFLGRTAAAPNLVVATSHAMLGLSLAPATARIVADVIEERDPGFDLRLLSPDRFA
jgi:D-amino-acid dehydrogenase